MVKAAMALKRDTATAEAILKWYNWNATNDFTCYGRQGLANGAEIGSRHRS